MSNDYREGPVNLPDHNQDPNAQNNPRSYDSGRDLSGETSGFVPDPVGAQALRAAEIELQAAKLVGAVQAGNRAFIAPAHKQGRFLVRGGKQMMVVSGTSIAIERGMQVSQQTEVGRVGDVWLSFVGGIAIIDPSTEDGQVQLQWCLDHPDMCRDAVNDNAVEVWASLKEGQLQKIDQEPSIPTSLNIDAALKGDFSSFGESGSIAARARALLAQSVAV